MEKNCKERSLVWPSPKSDRVLLSQVLVSMERFPYVLKMLSDSAYRGLFRAEKTLQRALEAFLDLNKKRRQELETEL